MEVRMNCLQGSVPKFNFRDSLKQILKLGKMINVQTSKATVNMLRCGEDPRVFHVIIATKPFVKVIYQ